MPSVDDFIRRFGGSGTMDDHEAGQYFDRFASTNENDRDYDNDAMYRGATEYLGQLPDNDFDRAAQSAYAQAQPQQRQGLLGGLLGALQGRGVNQSTLQQQLGLNSMDPQAMGPGEYARLANYARRNHPEVMRDQVREQPWMVKAMGNPILMGVLGAVAGKLIQNKTGGRGGLGGGRGLF